jgi:hypothetical protein
VHGRNKPSAWHVAQRPVIVIVIDPAEHRGRLLWPAA